MHTSAPALTRSDTLVPATTNGRQTMTTSRPAPAGWFGAVWRRLGRDLGYILPGLFLSVLGLGVLLVLFVAGVATFPFWIGAVVLPLALVAATGFAQISRARLELWGAHVEPPRYREPRPGLGGWMRLMLDGRRWLDLLFEMLLAFPLRLATFVVTVVWTGVALGGVTYFFWGQFLPRDETNTGVGRLLEQLPDSWISPTTAQSFTAEAIGIAVLGLICLLTLPWVVRLMALVDAAATRTALGGLPGSTTVGGGTS